jgi:hypothetical protein
LFFGLNFGEEAVCVICIYFILLPLTSPFRVQQRRFGQCELALCKDHSKSG